MLNFNDNTVSVEEVKALIDAEVKPLRRKLTMAYTMAFMSLLSATVLLLESILTKAA